MRSKSIFDFPVQFDCTRQWTPDDADHLVRRFRNEGFCDAQAYSRIYGSRFGSIQISTQGNYPMYEGMDCSDAELFLHGVICQRKSKSLTFPVCDYKPDPSACQLPDNISFYTRSEVESLLADIHCAGITGARILEGDGRGNFVRVNLSPFGIHWPAQARWFLAGFKHHVEKRAEL